VVNQTLFVAQNDLDKSRDFRPSAGNPGPRIGRKNWRATRIWRSSLALVGHQPLGPVQKGLAVFGAWLIGQFSGALAYPAAGKKSLEHRSCSPV
jgi:hypothetical protein